MIQIEKMLLISIHKVSNMFFNVSAKKTKCASTIPCGRRFKFEEKEKNARYSIISISFGFVCRSPIDELQVDRRRRRRSQKRGARIYGSSRVVILVAPVESSEFVCVCVL